MRCSAGHAYPVVDEVPRFVSAQDYSESFGLQWNRWSHVQLDSHNGTRISEQRFRRYVGAPASVEGKRVLDAGCGAGAFIDVVSPQAKELVAFDLSSAVTAAHANFGDRPNVHIAQGDIYSAPVADESFDLVYCLGVIQHTPDPERAFAALAKLVKPGGTLAVWIYERAWWESVRPRRLMRRYTTRRFDPGEEAFDFIRRFAPPAIRLRRAVRRVPGGRYVAKAIPIPDLDAWPDAAASQLSEEQLREWTILDIHDWLITHYEYPQRPADVRAWFERAGFDAHRRPSEGIAMAGTKR